MKVSVLLLGLLTLTACQVTGALAPNPTAPGTSDQVVTLPPSVFAADISGAQETPAVTADGHGYGVFLLNPAKDTLTVRAYVAGLSGSATAAHLHAGAAGQSGEAVKTLTVAGDVITGTWKKSDAQEPLTDVLVARLLKGEIYLNVHTPNHADGELRGQLTATTDSIYPIYLSGAEEVPPVSGTASGVAWVRVSADGSQLQLQGQLFGLSGPATAAHLHKAAKGSNGEVLKDVSVNGTNLSLSWQKSDASAPLTAGIRELLQQGQLYLNAHTAAHPDGEVRGQLQ